MPGSIACAAGVATEGLFSLVKVRVAVEADLPAIVSLTTEHRGRLAGWAPVWWRKSATADRDHPGWLAHMLRASGFVLRVAEEDEAVVGCAVSVPQQTQWFIDDVALSDDNRWWTTGVAMCEAVAERPALTCIPSAHSARLSGSLRAGLRPISSYWIGPPLAGLLLGEPLDGRPVPRPPRHTFGGGLDPHAAGALCFVDGDGIVVGSPSLNAPPIYEPAGTVCVVDRITGSNRTRLLDAALARAFRRGDVLVNVIVSDNDDELVELVAGRGLERTVDVFAWPEPLDIE